MSDIGPESTLLGYSAFALGMALSAPFRTLLCGIGACLEHLDDFVGLPRMAG
jgi:hypothetical protein